MNVDVSEVMHSPVMTITKHETLGHAAKLMKTHKVSALPVVDSEGSPLGMITATDLLGDHAEATPVSSVMSKPALTVQVNDGPHIAARIMRNHHTHHVVVIEDHKVAGIVSSFDLLQLVEEHRFQMKQAPTPSSRKKPNRQ